MPITRRQFDLGIDDTIEEWMRKVNGLLSQKRSQAFSENELREAFAGDLAEFYKAPPEVAVTMLGPADPIRLALGKLLELDAIGARIVRGTEYYAYAGELPI